MNNLTDLQAELAAYETKLENIFETATSYEVAVIKKDLQRIKSDLYDIRHNIQDVKLFYREVNRCNGLYDIYSAILNDTMSEYKAFKRATRENVSEDKYLMICAEARKERMGVEYERTPKC